MAAIVVVDRNRPGSRGRSRNLGTGGLFVGSCTSLVLLRLTAHAIC